MMITLPDFTWKYYKPLGYERGIQASLSHGDLKRWPSGIFWEGGGGGG